MENYFDFYGMEELFSINESKLKQEYLKKSKEFHPDFFLDDTDKYEEALHVSSLNNQAYKQLKSLDRRIEYILKLNDVLKDADNKIPQEFLMEMMDVNESIMDLKMDPDDIKLEKLKSEVSEIDHNLWSKSLELGEQADSFLNMKESRLKVLDDIKDIFLKRKYVLRIKESLNTFAPL